MGCVLGTEASTAGSHRSSGEPRRRRRSIEEPSGARERVEAVRPDSKEVVARQRANRANHTGDFPAIERRKPFPAKTGRLAVVAVGRGGRCDPGLDASARQHVREAR